MMQQNKEQARARLLHAALMFAGTEQFAIVHPPEPLMDNQAPDTWLDEELTRAVLNYLPHVTILQAKP